MARACPACGRPNADSAAKCLYCVAPLPPAEAASPATEEAVARRHLLILLPGGGGEEAVAALSRIAALPPYDARMFLSSPRPRLFRKIEDEAEARRLSEALASGRIAHYVVPEASVLALPIARASRIEIGERYLEPVLDGALPRLEPVPYGDLLLLVRGEITRERHHEKRVGSTKGASRRLTSGLRLHIYTREAPLAIEVDPELFEFRLPPEEQTGSVLLNFEGLIARIREKAPGLAVDRGFDHEPLVLSRASEGDVANALASSDRGADGVPYDDERSFRYYARWRYRVARHLAKADPA